MSGNGYFPVSIKGGIAYKGSIYTPISLLDKKAGTNQANFRLIDNSTGYEIELAKSCTTKEWQLFNLGREEYGIEGCKNAAIFSALTENIKLKDKAEYFIMVMNMAEFVDQVNEIMIANYEDTLDVDIDDEKAAEYRSLIKGIKQRVLSLNKWTEDFKERVGKPFLDFRNDPNDYLTIEDNSIFREMQKNGASCFDQSYYEKKFINNALKGNLSVLEQRVEDCVSAYKRGEDPAKIHLITMESDFLQEFLRTFLCGKDDMIYFTWNDEMDVDVMVRWPHKSTDREKNSITLIDDKGNEEYFTQLHRFSRPEYNLAMSLITESAIIERIGDFDMVDHLYYIENIYDQFPIELENGKLWFRSIEGLDINYYFDNNIPNNPDCELKVQIGFPAYAIVDFTSDEEKAILMDPGIIEMTYITSFKHGLYFLGDYQVLSEEGGEYLHSFLNLNGKIAKCGFGDPMWKSYRLSISDLIDENYRLILSFLTHGMNGRFSMSDLNKLVNDKPTFIEGIPCDRYVSKQDILDYNGTLPDNKKIEIGDGRAK